MKAVVSGCISFRAADCHPKVIEQLWHDLSFPNPEYLSRQRMGRRRDDVPRAIECLYQDDAGWVHLPRGAVELLRRRLRAIGEDVTFEDRRVLLPSLGLEQEVRLRPYQRNALRAMEAGIQGTVLMPCGGGKTVVGIGAIAQIQQPTLVLVHTRDLAEQWRERIALCLGEVAGLIGGGKRMLAPITVAMVQSLARIEAGALAELGQRFGCVIIDEAHHAPALNFRHVLAHLPARYRFGLTATPEREDGLTPLLDLCIGPRLFEIGQPELVALGYLTRPEVRVLPSRFTFEYEGPEDHGRMMAALTLDEERNQRIVDQVLAEARAGHTVLVLSGRVAHCQHLAARIAGQGVRAQALVGGTVKAERRAHLEAFRMGRLPVLVASTVADEGLDVPRLGRLVLTYPGRAKGRIIQRLGRLMRPHPGKDAAILYDVVDVLVPPLLRQWHERRRLYREITGQVPEAVSDPGGFALAFSGHPSVTPRSG